MFKIDINKCKDVIRLYDYRLKYKWYGLNSTTNCGCCTYLFKKYGQPETVQEFYNSYINDHVINSRTNGRNEDYLLGVAKVLQELDNFRENTDVYFIYIIQKLFVDTFNGCQKEKEVKDIIENAGFKCESPTYNEDIKFGIDLKVYKNNILKYLVQVKPNTFFYGNNNKTLINDRKNAIIKEERSNEKYKVPTYYVIYSKNTGKFIPTKNNKLCHKLTNLIDNEGLTLN